MRLENKMALVTGGGSGIGQAICELFASEGAHVAVVDWVEPRAQSTATRIREQGDVALAVQCDVSSEGAVSAAVETSTAELGQIDILVNNAGISVGDDILAIDEPTWDRNLNVVLKGVYLCSRAVLPGMIEQRSGAIVNIASVNGLMGIGEEAYSAAKAGVINLTKNMAVRYGQFGVRANVICPGTVETPIWQETVEQSPDIFDRLAKWYPLGRVGQPEDVAQAALYLASDDAAWVTGSVLNVDGGLMAGIYAMGRDLEGEE